MKIDARTVRSMIQNVCALMQLCFKKYCCNCDFDSVYEGSPSEVAGSNYNVIKTRLIDIIINFN